MFRVNSSKTLFVYRVHCQTTIWQEKALHGENVEGHWLLCSLPALFSQALSTCPTPEQTFLAWPSYQPAALGVMRERWEPEKGPFRSSGNIKKSVLSPEGPGRPAGQLTFGPDSEPWPWAIPFSPQGFCFPIYNTRASWMFSQGPSNSAFRLTILWKGVAQIWLPVIYLEDFQRERNEARIWRQQPKVNWSSRTLADSVQL